MQSCVLTLKWTFVVPCSQSEHRWLISDPLFGMPGQRDILKCIQSALGKCLANCVRHTGHWSKTKQHQEVFYPISSTMMQHNYASAISKGNLMDFIFTVPPTAPDREIISYAMLPYSFHACGKCSTSKLGVQRVQFNCQAEGCQWELCALCAFTSQPARKGHFSLGLQENGHKGMMGVARWWGQQNGRWIPGFL